jgi:hypothetical protein
MLFDELCVLARQLACQLKKHVLQCTGNKLEDAFFFWMLSFFGLNPPSSPSFTSLLVFLLSV